MPTYNFRNIKTGEIFERFMSIADSESFLKENPEIEKMPTLFGCGGVNDLKMKKPDGGFREVMSKISESSTIGRRAKESLTKF